MSLRVLTWNLLHGRTDPPAGRYLLDEFSAALAGWEWDAALLQEVPPWWPPLLAERVGAEHRLVLTSRNAALPLRRAIAMRWPDLIKSNGGGCNAILVRGDGITAVRTLRLCRVPERRQLLGVRLRSGVWLGTLHASVRNDAGARSEAALAARTMLSWAAGAPVVLAGDFNVRSLALARFDYAGGFDVDLVFVHGLAAQGRAEELDRGTLSDHAPVAVTLATD
ncbi:MAG: endonuclease/exonuclease/phosphatase family protein [Actinomycetota bacterium]|nr:endonuclease/exonuclease/phosphatase family protein [Actinomycetota bacterium]